MKFIYSTQEAQPYKFSRIGGSLAQDNTVELSDAAYRRFLAETANTTHTLTLWKADPWTT